MNLVWVICKKEFQGYFNSLIAYIFTVLFLAVINFLFIWFVLIPSQSINFSFYFEFLLYGIWFIIPAITMRSWAEEKKLGTAELLLTFPVKDWEVVFGKYLAGVIFFGLILLLSLVVPLSTALIGSPDWTAILSGYLGVFLVACSFIAVGTTMSALTKSQTIAFLLSLVICLFLLGIDNLLNRFQFPLGINFLINYLDVGWHFDSIARGVVDSRDIIYYLSLVFFFLTLNKYLIERRRWS